MVIQIKSEIFEEICHGFPELEKMFFTTCMSVDSAGEKLLNRSPQNFKHTVSYQLGKNTGAPKGFFKRFWRNRFPFSEQNV